MANETTESDIPAQLEALEQEARAQLGECAAEAELNEWRTTYLGRSGKVTQLLRGLGGLPKEERPRVGQMANQVKERLAADLEGRQAQLKRSKHAETLRAEALDVTLPGDPVRQGQLHPTTQILNEILGIFERMGFQVVEGPEVEWDRYNFAMLNIPADHPARDMWDTFYVDEEPVSNLGSMLLRTHTSPVQIRVMEDTPPPVRIVAPGRVYRNEATDASHEAIFYQVEGLAVDDQINMGDLKGVLTAFARELFGSKTRVRFNCSYFPFVEPGAEVSISCHVCGGSGCRVCKQTGWLEILGCGMVHPNVLRAVNYDPDKYSGFAFGLGVERIAMLKYGIDDIRYFYNNDIRFLNQFR
jgi:phenylalanyl-tRNA synthetase alpha chain